MTTATLHISKINTSIELTPELTELLMTTVEDYKERKSDDTLRKDIAKSAHFEREYRNLEKKFRKISEDIESFEEYSHRELGIDLGSHLYKFRLKNSSIPTGQR
jgi:uncharacterized protein YhaN